MGGTERPRRGDDMRVTRVDEDESDCCQNESWGGRGGTLGPGARTRKEESGMIVGKRMATFQRILKLTYALSSPLIRGCLR